MYGQYKRIRNVYEGVLTGKGLTYGGSLARTEATGYGLLYMTKEMLKCNGIDIAGKTIAVSGSGKCGNLCYPEGSGDGGAKVVTCSDSTGWVYDPEGIDLAALKEIKEVKRGRVSDYLNYRPNAEYHSGKGVWSVKVEIALPCATQNELALSDAEGLVANGVKAVCEGANMPTTLGSHRVSAEERCPVRSRKSCKCRRCCHLRAGNEPEQRTSQLELRRSGTASCRAS